MRALFATTLLAGCSTIESETIISSHAGYERCESIDLVAHAFPGDWPQVIIEVREERACSTPIEDTVAVHRALKVDTGVNTAIAAGLGAGLGLAADIALVKAVEATGGGFHHYGGRGDEWLALPLLGAAALGSLVAGQDSLRPFDRLPTEVRVETRWSRRDEEVDAQQGLLAFRGGAPLGVLSAGRAELPLELAVRAYGRPLQLDGRPVDWSVRRNAWVPGLLPSCARTAGLRGRPIDQLTDRELIAAEADAYACAGDGWSFAQDQLNRAVRACNARFKGPCPMR